MKLLQLRYFKKVAELQNITHSSVELKVPQPALCKIIHQLEDELGIDLFERTGNCIFLNKNGIRLLKHVDEIFNLIENLKKELNDFNNITDYTITLSIKSAAYLMPKVINNFKLKYPRTKLTLVNLPSAINNIKDTECDIMIYSSLYKDERINSKCIYKEKIKLAVSKNHPLVKRKAIHLNEMTNKSFAYYGNNLSFIEQINHLCRQKGFVPKIAYRNSIPSIIRKAAAYSDIMVFVPEFSYSYKRDRNLVMLDIGDDDFVFYINLVWKNSQYTPKPVIQLKDFIIDYFTDKNLLYGR